MAHSYKDCPVCETPFEESKAGGYEAVRLNIKAKISDIAAYHTAISRLQQAEETSKQKHTALKSKIESLSEALKDLSFKTPVQEISKYYELIKAWKHSEALPDSTAFRQALEMLLKEIQTSQKEIELSQGDFTYAKALEKADKLIALKISIARLKKKQEEQQKVLSALTSQADFIDKEIRSHIQSFVDQLKTLINEYYKEIQQNADIIPEIALEFSGEDDANQQQLNLIINFYDREKVLPSGYLSDSQLHTLALSFRLAAIKLFNKGCPFIVLDDIVTSYDADHRKAIAALLATHFKDCQIILTTHEELFFKCLEDHLPKSNWRFKRIINLVPDFGPKFHDHKISEEDIEEQWREGKHATNYIRQAEEEWLLKMCRGFGVDIRIREVHKPYNYSSAELAESLYKYLKSAKIDVPNVTGISNPFLLSLKQGNMENFGSHFQDTIYAFQSIGDAKHRWKEFKEFCGFFACVCGNQTFIRPQSLKPLCDKCQAPFVMQLPQPQETAEA